MKYNYKLYNSKYIFKLHNIEYNFELCNLQPYFKLHSEKQYVNIIINFIIHNIIYLLIRMKKVPFSLKCIKNSRYWLVNFTNYTLKYNLMLNSPLHIIINFTKT